jgi:hypothetical protein
MEITVDKHTWNFDKLLHNKLQHIVKKIKKDNDHVICIDGKPGAGKTTLGVQIAKIIDPTFCSERICFEPDEFMEKAIGAKKYQVVLLDEAYRSWASTKSLTDLTFRLNSMMMEIRQKNLVFIIILPFFFNLNKTIALGRVDTFIHVYTRPDGRRGNFMYFDDNKKKRLYIFGLKTFDYHSTRPLFPPGTFNGYFPIDDQDKYLINKREMLEKMKRGEDKKESRTLVKVRKQRDALLFYLRDNFGQGNTQISNYLRDFHGLKLSTNRISEVYWEKADNRATPVGVDYLTSLEVGKTAKHVSNKEGNAENPEEVGSNQQKE